MFDSAVPWTSQRLPGVTDTMMNPDESPSWSAFELEVVAVNRRSHTISHGETIKEALADDYG